MRIFKSYKFWIPVLIILTFIIGVPFSILYLLNNGNPYDKYMVNKYIPAYLEEQGYSSKDIQEAHYVEPKHSINKDYLHGHYRVVFKDEPRLDYYYGLSKKGHHVKQFCEKDGHHPNNAVYINEEITKHSEKDCVHSLDNK